MAARLLLAILSACLAAYAAAGKVCTADAYGAKGDGSTLDTAAIQSAATACAQGGTLAFTNGKRYLAGTVVIAGRGVTVQLDSNVTLLQSNLRSQYMANQSDWYLLYFLNCTNCSLTGTGTVNGQSNLWVTGNYPGITTVQQFVDPTCTDPNQCRPRLVGVRRSSQIFIGAVKLVHPIFWNLHVFQSSYVTIEGTYIYGDPWLGNNDGLDIDSSQNVYVRGVNVSTCDDAICFKATDPLMQTTNVLVENCTVLSHASGFKLGTESVASFSNITVQNSVVAPGTHRALSIQLRDGGNVSGITFQNITAEAVYQVGDWWGAAEALYITAIPRTPTTKLGSLSGVKVLNVNATTENGIVLVGMPNNPLNNITIANMQLQLTNLTAYPGGFMDLRPGILGFIPNVSDSGLYVQNVQRLNITDLELVWNDPSRPTWGNSFTVANHTLSAMTSQGFSILDNRDQL